MRRKTIALSKEEYENLTKYKEDNYNNAVYGEVIQDLVDNENE